MLFFSISEIMQGLYQGISFFCELLYRYVIRLLAEVCVEALINTDNRIIRDICSIIMRQVMYEKAPWLALSFWSFDSQ